jgi:cell division protein FtsI (penicillin-binding protein 3)
MRAADLRAASLRLRIAGTLALLLFMTLGARAVQLTLIDPRGAERGRVQTGTVLRVPPGRGSVYDRNEAELALTVPAPSIYAIPKEMEDPAAVASALAPALGRSAEAIAKRLAQPSPFVFLARWVEPETAAKVEALDLPGIGTVAEPRRTYPLGEEAGAIVGFANIDGHGVRGIEQAEDAWLTGEPQRVPVERDARRRLLAPAGVDPRSAAGGDVQLTIDVALQSEVDAALADVMAATGSRAGMVVVLDVASGDLLAVAERPTFDPNGFRHTPYKETRARAFLDSAEPGSSMKPFVIAAALERRVIEAEDEIDCEEGEWRVPGKTLHDSHPHGLLDIGTILQVSSNICTAKIAFRLGAESHHAALLDFGFGAPTGSGFPDEASGLLRKPEDWRPVEQANIAFGQGVNVTGVQLAAATAVLARRGVWRAPRLVRARREPGATWKLTPPGAGRRVLRPQVADRVVAMLETVISPEGTGKYAELEGVRVAGKTGTAQKLDPVTRAYSNRLYGAWFAGLAPADDPRLVVVAMLDEPKGKGHSGGAVAAPLFARAMTAGLVLHGVATRPVRELPVWARIDQAPATPPKASPAAPRPAPKAKPSPVVASAPAPTAPARPAPAPALLQTAFEPAGVATSGQKFLVPDFQGLARQDVLQITEGLAVPVELLGDGRAVSQRPAPGTIVEGTSVVLSVRFDGGEH